MLNIILILGFLVEVEANWLLQCSACVDQTYYSDEKLKADVEAADTKQLLEQVKALQIQKFTHKEKEFYNKFFDREQLGILAQDLGEIMPSAVSTIPERRYTNELGTSMVNKNVTMVRDSHLLFSALGALNHLAHDVDSDNAIIQQHETQIGYVREEQELNKHKREMIMEQLLKSIATTEVLAKALQHSELSLTELQTNFALLEHNQKEAREIMKKRIDDVESNIIVMKEILEKEAHTDLVEKRKRSEADLEKTRVLKEIEQLRYDEEQKTIKLREAEKKSSEAAIMAMHKDKIEYEQQKKVEADKELLQATEESNMRQHTEKAKHEKEIKQMEVDQEKYKADKELEQAVERAKIEHEMKIREVRENEDVHARETRMKLDGQKAQVIAGIQATAKIIMSWLSALYGSSQNMLYAVGSFFLILIGVYFTREMAVLLREQLNKRLGRPSLVRFTSKKTRIGEFWTGIKNCIMRKKGGHEFDDVVLHAKLQEQVFRLANATRNAKQRNMPLLHIMFYGPPGTGKTMCAQRFAEYSGLEYAFMSGADVAPLEEQAVTELHKLFTWVTKSRKGVLLFIDEADAFLAVRNKNMSESLRNALTTMLYHTGTPTNQFLMVLATNRPGDLDPAVLDRIDESVEFGLPDVAERERMVKQYFNMYVTRPLKIKLAEDMKKPTKEDVNWETLQTVSKQIIGFSGREIAKLFTGLQTHICAHMKGGRALATKDLKLTKKTLLEVVQSKVEEHGRTIDVLTKGYNYVHQEKVSTPLNMSMSLSQSATHNLSRRELASNMFNKLGPATPQTEKNISSSTLSPFINSLDSSNKNNELSSNEMFMEQYKQIHQRQISETKKDSTPTTVTPPSSAAVQKTDESESSDNNTSSQNNLQSSATNININIATAANTTITRSSNGQNNTKDNAPSSQKKSLPNLSNNNFLPPPPLPNSKKPTSMGQSVAQQSNKGKGKMKGELQSFSICTPPTTNASSPQPFEKETTLDV